MRQREKRREKKHGAQAAAACAAGGSRCSSSSVASTPTKAGVCVGDAEALSPVSSAEVATRRSVPLHTTAAPSVQPDRTD